MIVLPPSTEAPDEPFGTRHAPPRTEGSEGYRAYRSCLRWEFGFTCPFCLLHEADFSAQGAEGLGVFWIEHHEPVSAHPDRANDYENCIYSCRLCNRARADAPVTDQQGRRLLNPRVDVWADHLVRDCDRLVPRDESPDAAYTCDAYDVNDVRKSSLRSERRQILAECLELLAEGGETIQELLRDGGPTALAAAAKLRRFMQLAEIVVHRYAAIPSDADKACRCGLAEKQMLPKVLVKQYLSL